MGGSVGKVLDPVSTVAGAIPGVGKVAGPAAGYITGGPLGAFSSFAGQAIQGNYGGGGGGGGMRLSTRGSLPGLQMSPYQRNRVQQSMIQPEMQQPIAPQPEMQPVMQQPVMQQPMPEYVPQQPIAQPMPEPVMQQPVMQQPVMPRPQGIASLSAAPTLSAGRFQQFSMPGRTQPFRRR